MLLPNIDTRIEEFELPAKLVTRLKICKARTFGDIMKIDAADWTTVTPKVVNALRRFQNTYKNHYKKLTGEVVEDDTTETVETSYMKKDVAATAPSDERRFFVANNILNAYASAGKLYGERPLQEVMQEIISAADAFMDAFNGKKPQERKSRRHQRVETMVNDDKEATEAEIQPPIGEIPIVDGLLVVMDTPEKEAEVAKDETAPAPQPAAEEEPVAAAEAEPNTEGTVEEPTLEVEVEIVAPIETVEQPIVDEAPIEEKAEEPKSEEPQAQEINTEEAKAEESKAEDENVDPAHPKVTPGDIIVLTAYHGRRPSTSRNFQLGSAIKIESTHIDQTGVLQLRGFCGRKPANIDATRWDWVVCNNIEEAQALSSTIMPTPQPKAAAKTGNVGDTVSDHSETLTPTVAAEEPAPVIEEPQLPVAEEVAAPVIEEPQLPVAQEVEPAPVSEEPQLPVAEEAETAPVIEEAQLHVTDEVEPAPVIEESELPVADEVEPAPAIEEPQLPVAEEVEPAPMIEEPQMPVADEVETAPVSEEPELPVADEVEPAPVIEEPELPVADEVEPAPVAPIEETTAAVEEPAPVNEYPQQHRKHDMSGIPQLFDLFLTEEEENAGLPF